MLCIPVPLRYVSFLILSSRYEINTANKALFDNLTLNGVEEVLPGRLFSTRMPRDLVKNPQAGDKFKAKVRWQGELLELYLIDIFYE